MRFHPGLCFRDLHRLLGWPLGSLQRHLARLVDEGRLVALRHRNTVRYFEAGAGWTAAWRQAVALNDPDARRLHDWLLAHPRVRQPEVGSATREWGWTRTRMRRRLAMLAEAGLASCGNEGPAVWCGVPAMEGLRDC